MWSQGFERIRKKLHLRGGAVIAFAFLTGSYPSQSWPEALANSSDTGTSSVSSKSSTKTSVSISQKHRRHRRLKVRRNFKPMPPLSEAPFASNVPLLF